jgi:Protein of unknown function (DUF3037)
VREPSEVRAGVGPGDNPDRANATAPGRLRLPFEYAIVRVVPRVERGEGFNAGIVMLSRPHRFLGARTRLDVALLYAMAPECDADVVRAHLDGIDRIAAGDPTAGPIAALSAPERFHWLVSPASTIIQPSPVHTGLTADPAETLDHLFRTLVER